MNKHSGRDFHHSLFLHALFHPDYTVGFGISPNLLTLYGYRAARGLMAQRPHTAGGESHPALRTG